MNELIQYNAFFMNEWIQRILYEWIQYNAFFMNEWMNDYNTMHSLWMNEWLQYNALNEWLQYNMNEWMNDCVRFDIENASVK